MDIEKEKRLLAKYPFHIYLMVKAAKKALDEGRVCIQDGMLVPCQRPKEEPSCPPEMPLTSGRNEGSPSIVGADGRAAGRENKTHGIF